MREILEKHILYLLGAVLILPMYEQNSVVVLLLLGIVVTEASLVINNRKIYIVFLVLFGLCIIYLPEAAAFIPIVLYDAMKERFWGGLLILVTLFSLTDTNLWLWQVVLFLIACGQGILGAYIIERLNKMELEYIELRDASTETAMHMKEKNKELMEKQDYEVHVATLTERNRIAREIHDNVGHMLSRSILQMGALQTIYKEEPLNGQLKAVSETLNEAMNNIRESVHDLHDESVDMKQGILDAVKDVREDRELSLDYDVSSGVPRNIKYCIISIVKEAMNNILKHSNATKVTVILREHPAFYQILIEDNGTNAVNNPNPGIGLRNMTDRVESLGGTINFSTDNGFRIMISIKKD